MSTFLSVLLILIIVAIGSLILKIISISLPTTGEKIPKYSTEKKALVIIDVQEDFTGTTATTPFPYRNSIELINNINTLITKAEKENIPVIYIKHELEATSFNKTLFKGKVLKGNIGTRFDSRLKIINNNIFTKNIGDSFSNPKLDKFLRLNEISKLYVCGLDASGCVRLSSLGARNRHYKVIAIKDAIVTLKEDKIDEIFNKYVSKGIDVIDMNNLIF